MSGPGGNDTITHEVSRRGTGRKRAGVTIVTEACAPVHRPIFWDGRRIEIGRSCEHAINDPKLSGRHLAVEYRGDGVWWLTDLGSKNGTFVNRLRIATPQRPFIARGPVIVVRIGASHLLLEEDIDRYSLAFVRSEGGVVIGASVASAYEDLGRAAQDGINALILAESGAGKELAAKEYHLRSRHSKGDLIARSAASLSDGLADAQLFGAMKGAGSGVAEQKGWFELAHGGTLFLDEVGELPLELQAKLLRVLQEREIVRLGSSKTIKVDFRLVCATHRDLLAMVEQGTFREDLYARIAQEVVRIPPLRERKEEIPWLIALHLKKKGVRAEPEFIEACLLYQWPRNVRQLEAVVTSAARRAGVGGVATIDDLDPEVRAVLGEPELEEPQQPSADDDDTAAEEPDYPWWPDVKRIYLETGNAAKAAQLAGAPVSTASRWIKRLGLVPRRPTT